MDSERMHQASNEITRANDILSSLGLTWEDIKSRERVLDIGARDCAIAKAATQLGIQTQIISLDRAPPPVADTPVVEADAARLPFEDKTFDLVISHAAPPATGIETRQELETILGEIRRVLRKNGEARFGSKGEATLPYFIVYEDYDIHTFDFQKAKTPEEIERRQEMTLALLRQIDPVIEQIVNRKGDSIDSHYHRLIMEK